ncbi:MAG: LamG domain-containing protein, partial [Candidatus Thorarchaeota archaeon]
ETATESEYFDFTLSSIATDTWQHVVLVRAGDTCTLYIDGSFVQQVVTTGADTLIVDSIGGTVDIDRMFNGTIDEVRVLDRQISAGWISTEYNNQEYPSTFYSVGTEEIVGGGQGGGSGFRYSKDITIDHTKINSNLNDFPVMIELFDTDLRSDVQADGDDIVFKNGTNVLDHEIELFDQTFNSTHSHLVAWIRLDLSSTVDTTITM